MFLMTSLRRHDFESTSIFMTVVVGNRIFRHYPATVPASVSMSNRSFSRYESLAGFIAGLRPTQFTWCREFDDVIISYSTIPPPPWVRRVCTCSGTCIESSCAVSSETRVFSFWTSFSSRCVYTSVRFDNCTDRRLRNRLVIGCTIERE